MNIENVKWNKAQTALIISFIGKTDKLTVPLDPANRHYAEIMRQVEAGELEIQPADNGE